MDKTIICTLFEGNYHYGLAALVNSLYKYGFRGKIYAGYRGYLPNWALKATESDNTLGLNTKTIAFVEGLKIHFVLLETDCHLTNYKPDFMLKVNDIENPDNLFYFDPDIVVKCDWKFFERWTSFGIGLVHEIVWNDMPSNHPKRKLWASVANSAGMHILNTLSSNINAGFIGLNRDNLGFLHMWKDLMNTAEEEYNFDKKRFFQSDNDFSIFKVGDQDMLNLAAMCTKLPLSEFGPDGMDFIGGGWLMSHAVGSPKPWRWNFIFQTLKGLPPNSAVKTYWSNVDGLIKCYSTTKIRVVKFQILLSSFISRFYKRN